MRLLVRHGWQFEESWPGYLLRIANDNRLCGINGLGELLGSRAIGLVAPDPRAVLAKLGLPSDGAPAVRGLTSKQPKTGLRSELGRNCISGICARCLNGDVIPFIRASWELPLEVDCAIHGTALTRVCPTCGRQISIYRTHLLYCDCGFFLLDAECRDVYRQVPASEYHRIFGLRGYDLTFSKIDPQEAMAMQVLRGIAHFEKFKEMAININRLRGGLPYLTEEQLLRAERWFIDWPRSFQDGYLEASWANEYIGRRYIHRAKLGCAKFPLIAAQISGFGALHPDVLRRREFVSPNGGAVLAGRTRPVLLSWINAGYLGDVRVIQGEFQISVQALLKFLDLTKDAVEALDAAEILGILPGAIHRLVENDLLPAVMGITKYKCWIKRSALADFLSDLIGSVIAEPEPKGEIRFLGRIFASHYNPTSLKAHRAIRDGRLQIYCKIARPTDLSAVYVYEQDFRRRRVWGSD